YARLDELRDDALADDATSLLEVPVAMLQALRAGDAEELAPVMLNDLEAAAVIGRPDLERALADGVRMGALTGIVSGSGPTTAFLCADPEAARLVQAELRATGREALHVHGPVPGAQILSA